MPFVYSLLRMADELDMATRAQDFREYTQGVVEYLDTANCNLF